MRASLTSRLRCHPPFLLHAACALAFAVCGAVAPPASLAGPRDLFVVHPGGAAASEEAQAQITRLIAEIGRRAGWEEGSGTAAYFNHGETALTSLRADKPGFLLSTPGFYLTHRAELGLDPVNQLLMDGRDTHSYFLVAMKDGPASLDDLTGKTLAGATLSSPGFVEKVVLEGRFTFGKDLTAHEMRGLRALRKLTQGAVDVVILDEKEKAALPALPFAGELNEIFASKPVPNTGILALSGVATSADRAALLRATERFCEEGEGKSICETYGISGFQAPAPGIYDALIQAFGGDR